MLRKWYVLTPGPTQIPAEALLAEAQPSMHHRTSEFSAIFKHISEGLQFLHQTKHEVLTFAASGTGGMESAVVNLLSPGDKAVVIRGGKFGERWGEIAATYGCTVVNIDVEWGRGVDPNVVAEILKANPDTKAVFATQSETSTGVVHDIQGLAQVVAATDALLVVDAISSTAIHELRMDEWKLDVVVTGSQKGLMLPPGLAFVAIGPRAWKAAETAKCPKFYWEWKSMRKNLADNTTTFTPAVSLIRALEVILEKIKQEGLENIWARHTRLAEATRIGVQALGLKLLAPASPSNVCTAVFMPDGMDGGKFNKYLREEQGIVFAPGQGHLKGKIFRIGHCGYVNEYDILVALGAVEHGLAHFGHAVELGTGVAAVSKFFNQK